MRSEPDVLIAGAGPTGLTLACGLLANGVAARVVDKAVGPAGTSRALGLQPRGIEVVERLGALNGLPERALQVERIIVHINGKHAASVRVGQRTPLVTRPGLVISQAEVNGSLQAWAAWSDTPTLVPAVNDPGRHWRGGPGGRPPDRWTGRPPPPARASPGRYTTRASCGGPCYPASGMASTCCPPTTTCGRPTSSLATSAGSPCASCAASGSPPPPWPRSWSQP